MRQREKQKPATRSAPALPPIPTDTPAGIRALAIADTIRALEDLPNHDDGLGLQQEDYPILSKRLAVPPLYIESIYRETFKEAAATEGGIAEYVTWRQRLAAAKAVA